MKRLLLELIGTRLPLLGEHASAYAQLLSAEAELLRTLWLRRALLWILAACMAGAALILGGVAVMLWAVAPIGGSQLWWVLWVVPMTPCVVALGCLAGAAAGAGFVPFEATRQQLRADASMLRESVSVRE